MSASEVSGPSGSGQPAVPARTWKNGSSNQLCNSSACTAGANNSRKARSKIGVRVRIRAALLRSAPLGIRTLTPIFFELEEDFVAAHQAELVTGALLDRLGAGFHVVSLGREPGGALLQPGLAVLLLGQVVLDLPGPHPAAFADP